MKKILAILIAQAALLTGCNNAGKDSVEKADSSNEANLDTALNRNAVVIDENSSSFLVRVANAGLAETAMTQAAQEKAISPAVKGFAALLHRDHSALNAQVLALAAQKNIVLPAAMTPDKQKELEALQKNKGENFDKIFLTLMIRYHEASMKSFTDAMLDAKDPDIRSFADKSLTTLRAHLDAASLLQKENQ